jgi:hypothetical protein
LSSPENNTFNVDIMPGIIKDASIDRSEFSRPKVQYLDDRREFKGVNLK